MGARSLAPLALPLLLAALLPAALPAAGGADQADWRCGGAPSAGRTWPRGDIVVRAGQPLAIDCELKPEADGPAPSGSQLLFERGGDPVEPAFLSVNGSTLRLRVPSPPESDSTYYCKMLGPSGEKIGVCLNNVVVSVPPRDVEDFSCLSANWNNLTCTWRAPHNYLPTTYALTFRLGRRPGRLVLSDCPKVVASPNGLHSCFWGHGTVPHYRQTHPSYVFTLTGANALGSNVQNFTFDHYARVLPDPPEAFRVLEKTSRGAKFSWKVPSPLELLPPGLEQRLLYCSEYDDPGAWTNAGDGPGFPRRSSPSVDNYTFELTGLKFPNTRYDVRLSLKSAKANNRLWSNFSSVTFRTLSEPPARPPDVDSGGFEATAELGGRTVYVYWKRIEPFEENGDNFTYRLRGPAGLRVDTEAGYAKLEAFPTAETTLTLDAANSVGASAASTSIAIPAQGRLLPEPADFAKIAFDEGVYELSWRRVDHPAVESYTLFWCPNGRDRPYQCEGRLQWTRVPATVENSTLVKNVTLDRDRIYQFAISANGRDSSSGMVWATCTIIPNKPVGKMRNVWINRVGTDYIEVSWKLDCADRSSVVRGYRIAYCPIVSLYDKTCTSDRRNVTLETFSSLGGSVNVTGLRPHTTYAITVAVLTKVGDGLPSDQLFNLTNEGKPTPPLDVAVADLTASRALVSWSPPASMNGVLKEYVVYYDAGYDRAREVKVGRTENHTEVELVDLVGYSNYTITVVACTVVCSDPSVPVRVRTAVGRPGPIEAPRSDLYNSSQRVVLSWDPPSSPAGLVDYFEVMVVKFMSDKNDTYLFNSTAREFEIPLAVCREPEITSYAYFVRAVNVDGALDHGAAAFTNANFVKISMRTPGEFDPVLYKGPWSKRSDNICLAPVGSKFMLILGVLVIAVVAVGLILYFSKRIYVCYRNMKNIKPCMPPGLEAHLGRDLKQHSGKWGGDTDKLTKPTPDAEFLLLTKDSSRSSDIKRGDNCDNSNCSVNTESTAFSMTSSNRLSDDAKDSPEPLDDGRPDSLSANSSLRLRNVNVGSRPASAASSEPCNSPNGLERPDGMPPYSAVGVWPPPADFNKTEAASIAANQKGYVSFGSFANDRSFAGDAKSLAQNVLNLPQRSADRESKGVPAPLINIYNNHVEPIPDLPSNYVVTGVDMKPPANKGGYVSVNDPVVSGKRPNLPPPAKIGGGFGADSAYVQLPESMHFPNKPVIMSNRAYIKNSDLRTDSLDASPYLQKIPQNASTLKQNIGLSDNLMLENAAATQDSLSPTYCKIGHNADDPHPFDFQPADDMRNYLTDYSDHDAENNMFLTEPPAQSGNPPVSSHYVPHNPNVNRL